VDREEIAHDSLRSRFLPRGDLSNSNPSRQLKRFKKAVRNLQQGRCANLLQELR
jgi:hypothetical protein